MSTIHPEGSVVLIREYHNAEDTEPLFVEPGETSREAAVHWLLFACCWVLTASVTTHM